MDVIIDTNGNVRFIHNDDLAGLLAHGTAQINRASHVEPANEFGVGTSRQWAADMAPSGGPVLGPFESRTAALAAEVAWLKANRGL